MVIDFAKEHHIDSWMELLQMVKDSFPGLDMEEYKIALQDCVNNKQALVAKTEGFVVGALAFTQSTGELKFLAVHPSYRKKGIAKALVNYLITQFPSGSNLSVITYRQCDEQGAAARKLYQSVGFQCGKEITVFDYPCQELHYTIK